LIKGFRVTPGSLPLCLPPRRKRKGKRGKEEKRKRRKEEWQHASMVARPNLVEVKLVAFTDWNGG